MLRRLGNKSRLLPVLLPLFPENITTFVDMFLGSGAVAFAMVDRVKYVIANDNDDDVYNLFFVVKERKEELLDALTTMPVHESLFKHWKETEEQDPVWKAVRFLMLSNFGYMGKSEVFKFGSSNSKTYLLNEIQTTYFGNTIKFMNADFRDIFDKIYWIDEHRKAYTEAFIYADPPFLGTTHNYKTGFTESDTRDLFTILTSSGIRFALSEFRHPLVMALAEEHGLHVTSLGERRNMKNRREEILITNFSTERQQVTMF